MGEPYPGSQNYDYTITINQLISLSISSRLSIPTTRTLSFGLIKCWYYIIIYNDQIGGRFSKEGAPKFRPYSLYSKNFLSTVVVLITTSNSDKRQDTQLENEAE